MPDKQSKEQPEGKFAEAMRKSKEKRQGMQQHSERRVQEKEETLQREEANRQTKPSTPKTTEQSTELPGAPAFVLPFPFVNP
jgi:uncharacterized membrane protein